MTAKPLVTICIPTYNNGPYIGKTLKSVINQTYANLDILVCDNASTDNTQDIVNSLKDERIRYFRNATNIGSGKSVNKSIKLAKGEFIALYHSDDIYDLTIIEKELAFLIKHPEVGAVFTLDLLINEYDKIIGGGVKVPAELNNKLFYNFIEIFDAMLKKNGSFLVCPTFMCKKEIFGKIGLFDTSEKYGSSGSASDTAMWLDIAREYKIGIIKERLINRRISLTQDSSSNDAKRILRANHFKVLEHFLVSYELSDKIDKDTMKQYEFNKFFDDVLIVKNLLKYNKIDDAKPLLSNNLKWKNISYGFKGLRNFYVIIIFFMLIILIKLGFYKTVINLFKLIHKIKPTIAA